MDTPIAPSVAVPPVLDSLADYWEHGFPHVGGWVSGSLLPCLATVAATQQTAGIAGEVGEIGVYHGKLLLALAHMAAAGGKVTAIDVFEDQERNVDGAGDGNLEILRQNIGLYGPQARDYAFITADSIALTAVDKARIMAERGPFRLFSVDGCHTKEHTCTDMLTAQDFLAPGGVLILDDYMQPHWPGVTEAVHAFHHVYVPRIKPFLYAQHKLFYVGHGWHATFLNACLAAFAGSPDLRATTMFGSTVAVLYP